MALADLLAHKVSKVNMSFTFLQVFPTSNGGPLSWAYQVKRWELSDLTSGPCDIIATRSTPPGSGDITEARRGFQGWASCSRRAVGPAEAGAATCVHRELAGLARCPRSVLLSRKASSRKGTHNRTLQKGHLRFLRNICQGPRDLVRPRRGGWGLRGSDNGGCSAPTSRPPDGPGEEEVHLRPVLLRVR